MSWISVLDRLPELYESVLVINEGDIIIASLVDNQSNHKLCWYRGEYEWEIDAHNGRVTHWMPLPEVPQEIKKVW